eukprot:TRINITY_DN4726_c0_g1_i1.p1 TRINITY_DN4726_c0_g1~~TRINITY_DN4726_c0_g1_i1.p1  ORF type:complete len:332 (-),score=30.09 TRINITY_DN4726_c0_g1_i1:320-1222(-)
MMVVSRLPCCATAASKRPRPPAADTTDNWRQYSLSEEQVVDVEEEGIAVIIPGVSNKERADLVARNIHWLHSQGLPFDCWMFVYLSVEELPLNEADFQPCHIVRNEGYWLDHVLAFPLNMTKKPWILHLMDSNEPQSDVNLREMISIMRANRLGHSGLTFDPTGPDYYERPYRIMDKQRENKIGRFVDFIELHFSMFSRKYFACFQDNIDTDNVMGWGMDMTLPYLCGGSQVGSVMMAGRLGLIDKMTVVKHDSRSYSADKAQKQLRAYKRKHPEFLTSKNNLRKYVKVASLGELRPGKP